MNTNKNQEISQTTYVEIISVTGKTSIAVPDVSPNVETSLNRLAFNRKDSTIKRNRSSIIASPQNNINSQILKYNKSRVAGQKSALPIDTCALNAVVCGTPYNCTIDLAVVLDSSGSMAESLSSIKSVVANVADSLFQYYGSSCRFGLMTFDYCTRKTICPTEDAPKTGPCPVPSLLIGYGIRTIEPFPNSSPQFGGQGSYVNCDNLDRFKSKLNSIQVAPDTIDSKERWDQGIAIGEAGDQALNSAVGGGLTQWRDDPNVAKIILFVTDEPVIGCDQYPNNNSDSVRDRYREARERLYGIADVAKDCDIKIISVAAPARGTGIGRNGILRSEMVTDMVEIANRTNGIYGEFGGGGLDELDLFKMIFGYCIDVCQGQTADDCNNIITNGTFNTGISGWSGQYISWDSSRKALRISFGAATQTISDLNTGDLVTLFFDVTGSSVSSNLTYGFTGYTEDALIDPQTSQRLSINTNVSEDGVVVVHFESSDILFIDNVKLCLTPVEECGTGTVNYVKNPNFAEGVEYWNDAYDNQLTPYDNQLYWDQDYDAIVISQDGASEIRQTVSGLSSETSMTLRFTILSHGPDDLQEYELEYGIIDSNGNKIQKSIKNSEISSFPHQISMPFVVPSETIRIFMKKGAISNIIKLQSILLCNVVGCSPGYQKLSLDQFNTDNGLWNGGEYLPDSQAIKVSDSNALSRTYSDLDEGSEFRITTELLDSNSIIIDLVVGDVLYRFTSPFAQGFYTHSCVVNESGSVHVSIKSVLGESTVDNILVCNGQSNVCDGAIRNLKSKISVVGIPRTPINIFNIFAKVIIRNTQASTTTVYIIPEGDGHSGSDQMCNFWTQNGNSGSLETHITDYGLRQDVMSNTKNGDISSIIGRENWLWPIPYNAQGTTTDVMITSMPPEIQGTIESVEIFFLANNISPSGSSTPTNPGPFNCNPDPAVKISIAINYDRTIGKTLSNREISADFNISDLYNEQVDYGSISPKKWDEPSIGSGLKGSIARWESVKFVLDTTDGSGEDQCSIPTDFSAEGSGDINLMKFKISGIGTFLDPCDAEVIVSQVQDGELDNETQSIVLPNPSGGTWDLTVKVRAVEAIATIPWNAGYDVVQYRIGSLQNVGHGNVSVTGSGSSSDPYVVEFTNDLAGVNIPLMVADGSNLTGAASGSVDTITNGTKNERQTIITNDNTLSSLVVRFNGVASVPIIYNWSINRKEAAIAAIPTIGDGNIIVTGETTDRDSDYVGDLTLDYIGSLANTNVAQVVVSPSASYTVSTNWNGGSGVNEKQRIRLIASSGTFTIKIYDPGDESGVIYFITYPIQYDADESEISSAIVASGYFADSDISVTKTEYNDNEPLLNEWIIEFAGAYVNVDIKQMEIDSTELRGGAVTVVGILDGGESFEKQMVTIRKANGGYFKLNVDVDGISALSGRIQWNTTAVGFKAVLQQHPRIDVDEVAVVKHVDNLEPETVGRYTITFKGGFGNVPLMVPEYQSTLLCNAISLKPVPSPPYQYPLDSSCELPDFSCQSWPSVSRPCVGDEFSEAEKCPMRDEANVAIYLDIQRDLLDPNMKIKIDDVNRRMNIMDMAVIKGLNPSEFRPYAKNNNELVEVSYFDEVRSGLTIVLIENNLNTVGNRNRIFGQLNRGILPSRMVW